jgi:DMSO/TMAO reductase YedYZ heme-binding membrane subunit
MFSAATDRSLVVFGALVVLLIACASNGSAARAVWRAVARLRAALGASKLRLLSSW